MKEARKIAKAVVVGGSIAGISCAHTLLAAGWDVVVLEKTSSPPNSSATGAGVGLDTVSVKLIEQWTQQPQLIQLLSLPMTIEHVCEIFHHSKPAETGLYQEMSISILEQCTGLICTAFSTAPYHKTSFSGDICSCPAFLMTKLQSKFRLKRFKQMKQLR